LIGHIHYSCASISVVDELEAINRGVIPVVTVSSSSSGGNNNNGIDDDHRALFHPDAPTPTMMQILSVNDVMVTTTCYGAACLIWSFFDETFARMNMSHSTLCRCFFC
jgi:hypothetical protein